MLARARQAIDEREGGFTLIELLVVIIIIGILAAIAIPVFLNQRKKGYDAQTKSDLRNVATLQETFLTDCNYYAGVIASGGTTSCTAGIAEYTPSSNVTSLAVEKLYSTTNPPTVVASAPITTNPTTGVGGFCLRARSKSGKDFFYDSVKGGLQPPATTTC